MVEVIHRPLERQGHRPALARRPSKDSPNVPTSSDWVHQLGLEAGSRKRFAHSSRDCRCAEFSCFCRKGEYAFSFEFRGSTPLADDGKACVRLHLDILRAVNLSFSEQMFNGNDIYKGVANIMLWWEF
ncbi:hypothetical protein N665_0033s0047 [Sinapis alba]|nr:hypothetical protein N665_0033s0047 [Sinapis alba]